MRFINRKVRNLAIYKSRRYFNVLFINNTKYRGKYLNSIFTFGAPYMTGFLLVVNWWEK